jgi:hypothetical protein
LARAISEALARADAKYAIADRFDDAKGEYIGLKLGRLVEINFNSGMVLVRRDVAEAQLAKEGLRAGPIGRDGGTNERLPPSITARKRPRRFYAKIELDPNRPTPQVSNIAQIDPERAGSRSWHEDDPNPRYRPETTDGFPEDVENIVRDNAASLRITEFGSEGERCPDAPLLDLSGAMSGACVKWPSRGAQT